FRREARAMAQVDHPHIVPVYEDGEHQGHSYLTMKFMRGGSLARYLPRFGADPRKAVALVEKVARAVHHLPGHKVLHRHLKPHNSLRDENDEPCLGDFGLAKVLDADLDMTMPGKALGTLPYMAPEQAAGQNDRIGPATDVWALGVILYELLTGQRPF